VSQYSSNSSNSSNSSSSSSSNCNSSSSNNSSSKIVIFDIVVPYSSLVTLRFFTLKTELTLVHVIL